MERTEAGINRNIVECKDDKLPQRKLKTYVLIETSWNVKAKCDQEVIDALMY